MDPSSSQEEGNHVDANDPIYQVVSTPETGLPFALFFWKNPSSSRVKMSCIPERCCRQPRHAHEIPEPIFPELEADRHLLRKRWCPQPRQRRHCRRRPAWMQHRWNASACGRSSSSRRRGRLRPAGPHRAS